MMSPQELEYFVGEWRTPQLPGAKILSSFSAALIDLMIGCVHGTVHNYGLLGHRRSERVPVLAPCLTMSTISAMVTMMMAAMAQVLRAQRVLSIQVEKATSFLGKTCREKTRDFTQVGHIITVAIERTNIG